MWLSVNVLDYLHFTIGDLYLQSCLKLVEIVKYGLIFQVTLLMVILLVEYLSGERCTVSCKKRVQNLP